MSAHAIKEFTITWDLVARFARYFLNHGCWRVLHLSFENGNYTDVSELLWIFPDVTREDVQIAEIHDKLTPSQRRRLRRKAEVEADLILASRSRSPFGDPPGLEDN